MRTSIRRAAVASALAVPLMAAGMGLAAAAAPVLGPGPDAVAIDGQLAAAPGDSWFCLITSPGLGFVMSGSPAVVIPQPAAAGPVSGSCFGTGGFQPLTGTVG